MFKYEWIWIKHRPTGSTHAKNKPMKKHENILVFSSGTTLHKSQSKRRMPYYPQGLAPNHRDRIVNFNKRKQIVGYRPSRQKPHLREFTGYPNSVLEFPVDELGLHPVAKPVGLLEFLIETYTRPGERSCSIPPWGSVRPGSPRPTPGVDLLASRTKPSSFGSRQKCWALHDGIPPDA